MLIPLRPSGRLTTRPNVIAPIRLLERGEGPPLLLIHGNPDTADTWSPLMLRLEHRYRCLAPDLPGFGGSAVAEDFDPSLDSMARLALRLYRAVDPDKFRGWEDALRALAAQVLTIVLWGDHDTYIPARYAERFGAREVGGLTRTAATGLTGKRLIG